MSSFFSVRSLSSRLASREIRTRRNLGRVSNTAGKILSKTARFAGFLFGSVLNFFNLDISDLWDILVEGYFTLKTFDWNATDKELEAQIEANNKSIAVAAANTIGNYLGYGAVRLVNFFAGRLFASRSQQAAQGIKIPVLSARIGLALAEESNDELRNNVEHFLRTATSALIGNAFLRLTLAARRNELFGQKSITEPQTDGSIAAKIDEKIETLPEFWQQPAEALIEGFEDGIIEAGYVISYQIDDHIEALRFHDRNQEATPRTIEVQPHEDSEEKLIIQGAESEVKQALTIVRPVHQLIENRDVGQILGSPADDYITLKPQLRHLNIFFYSKKKPPYYTSPKDRALKSEISVPDVKSGLSWDKLKSVISSYDRGDYFVKCQLKNGRSMQVWATSLASGKKILTRLAGLSTESIVPDSFRVSQGGRIKVQRKTMYPAFATVLFQKDENSKIKNSKRVTLWTDKPPENFKPIK